jgi:hypothetical protein
VTAGETPGTRPIVPWENKRSVFHRRINASPRFQRKQQTIHQSPTPAPTGAVVLLSVYSHSATSMKKEPQMHTDCTQLNKRKAGFR